jgi:hypothetical protein
VISTALATILISGALVVGEHIDTSKSPRPSHPTSVELVARRVASTSKLIAACSRVTPNVALGLKSATIETRKGTDLALLFVGRTHYSLCLKQTAGISVTSPVVITQRSKPVYELESVGEMNKVKGTGLYTTNRWFVVRVKPMVTTLKVVTDGRSVVTSVHSGFALVHENETTNAGAKNFAYGLVVAFEAGGAFVGSASLS